MANVFAVWTNLLAIVVSDELVSNMIEYSRTVLVGNHVHIGICAMGKKMISADAVCFSGVRVSAHNSVLGAM
ncbi:hypothetical protein EDD22DRAFT_899966 [Suillus occidentalis]|nr:hypothetical protein EDD22DRAFT_899966 [Suillus occidentalis]